MKIQMTRVLLIICVLASAGCESEFYSDCHRQGAELMTIQRAIDFYTAAHGGRFDNSDNPNQWFSQLLRSKVLSANEVRSIDGQPFDAFGNPLVFVGGNSPFVRSVGRNGRDDRGHLDDWDSHSEPNWGHWYKRRWPLAIGGVYLTIIACVFLAVSQHRMSAIATIAVSMMTLPIIADPAMLHGSGFLPTPYEYIPLVGGLILLVVLAILIHRYVTRKNRISANQCVECGYSLINLTSCRCPECGFILHFDTDSSFDNDTVK